MKNPKQIKISFFALCTTGSVFVSGVLIMLEITSSKLSTISILSAFILGITGTVITLKDNFDERDKREEETKNKYVETINQYQKDNGFYRGLADDTFNENLQIKKDMNDLLTKVIKDKDVRSGSNNN